MNGRSRRRAPARRCDVGALRAFTVGALTVCLLAGAVAPASAQSGRNRSRPPAEQPAAPPAETGPQPKALPSRPTPEAAAPVPAPAPAVETAVPSSAIVVDQTQSGPTTRYALRNGLVVLIRENPAAPLAAVVTSVDAGADDESAAGLAGLAAASAATAPSRRLEAVGARLDVAVGPDAAVFSSVVGAESLDEAIAAHAELLRATAAQTSAPAPGALYMTPLDAVAERAASLAMPAAAPPATAATPDRASFLEQRYRPDRTVVVVSGRVDAFAALIQIQQLFAEPETKPVAEAPARQPKRAERTAPAPAAPVATAPAATPGPVDGLDYALEREGTGVALVAAAFDMGDTDPAVAELLGTALANGRASRLGRVLREAGLATGISASYVPRGKSGTLVIRFATDPASLDAVEAMAFREIDTMRRERLSDGELQRARNMLEKRARAALETAEGSALLLARLEARSDTARAAGGFVERARAATAEELQRAASSRLVVAHAAVVERVPVDGPSRSHTAASFGGLLASWAPGLGREVDPKDVRAAEPVEAVREGRERGPSETDEAVVLPSPQPVRDFSTLDGPRAFVREDQSRQLVSIGLFFPGGRGIEPTPGVTALMMRALLRGSKGFPGAKLVGAFEQIGGEAIVVDEPDFFGVVVEVLSRNADRAMEVLVDAINNPVFEEEDLKRERAALLLDQRLAAAGGASHAVDLFWAARYPGHAYGRPALGPSETVSRLGREQVTAWFDASVRARFPLVGVVGDTDGSSLVSRHVADGFDRQEGKGVVAEPLPQVTQPAEAVASAGRAVTYQAIGFPGPAGAGEAVDALDVAAAAGRARIAAELGSAGVDAWFEQRRLGGAAIFVLATAPGDEGRAREVALAALTKLGSAPLPDAELGLARSMAIVAYERATQPFTERLLEYVRTAAFGVALETVDTYAERARKVNADTVRRVATAVYQSSAAARGVARGR